MQEAILQRDCGSLIGAPAYSLNTSYTGKTFFDGWTFGTVDYTGGASAPLAATCTPHAHHMRPTCAPHVHHMHIT